MMTFAVTVETVGQRLDQFLRNQMPEYSRTFCQKLVADGHAVVNGSPIKPSYPVREGDRVSVKIPPTRPLATLPERIPLDVLYEDDDLIVVNKPAGMVVHPAAGNFEHTLVNALLHHCQGKLAGIGGVERPGIVHRLDKGTSGCIVVAKTDLAHQSLVEQFKSRAMRKVYQAICRGRFKQPTGRIETMIGRSAQDRKKMSTRVPHGRAALTEYRVLKQGTVFAWVELTIHTGRTHQIRVHMAHIGHPVVGDRVYGGRSEICVDRPLLHAYKLGFTHPRTGEFHEFTAPLPEDIELYARDC